MGMYMSYSTTLQPIATGIYIYIIAAKIHYISI